MLELAKPGLAGKVFDSCGVGNIPERPLEKFFVSCAVKADETLSGSPVA